MTDRQKCAFPDCGEAMAAWQHTACDDKYCGTVVCHPFVPTPDTPTDRPADDERVVLAELLRLYDWRFELAKEEKDIAASGNFNAARIEREKAVASKLRQYGAQKRAAWDRAREVLARREKEGKDNG